MISPECVNDLQMIYPVCTPEDVYRIQKKGLPEYLQAMNSLDAQHILGLESHPQSEDEVLLAFRHCHSELLRQEQKFSKISTIAGIYALKDEVPGPAQNCGEAVIYGAQTAEPMTRPSYMENPLEMFLFARAQMEYVRLVEWVKINAAKVKMLEELNQRLSISCPDKKEAPLE